MSVPLSYTVSISEYVGAERHMSSHNGNIWNQLMMVATCEYSSSIFAACIADRSHNNVGRILYSVATLRYFVNDLLHKVIILMSLRLRQYFMVVP